jgi:hypothetical protein
VDTRTQDLEGDLLVSHWMWWWPIVSGRAVRVLIP